MDVLTGGTSQTKYNNGMLPPKQYDKMSSNKKQVAIGAVGEAEDEQEVVEVTVMATTISELSIMIVSVEVAQVMQV